MRYSIKLVIFMFILVMVLIIEPADAARIKDIAEVKGMRGNTLQGAGLVVGLAGTGDSSVPSSQALASLLRRESGITLNPSTLASGSVALVMVTAELRPNDREGSLIDATVATLGDAKSLQGGMLLATELLGLDGEVYAVTRAAAVSTASWTVEGQTGSKVAKNHPTVGRIPNGAYVERAETADYIESIAGQRFFTILLRDADFTTAERIRQKINDLNPNGVYVEDPGTIRVKIPDQFSNGIVNSFIDRIIQLEVEVDIPAIVVINEKTGTIVVGGNVGISETAVAQGSLVVKIRESQLVSQPTAPFTSAATTQVVPESEISVEEQPGSLIPVPKIVTVSELVNALNAIGATPRDLIAIFNALRAAGALQAKLEIM